MTSNTLQLVENELQVKENTHRHLMVQLCKLAFQGQTLLMLCDAGGSDIQHAE